MVRGLDNFKNYFKDYTDNYVIIGGTACDIIIEEAGFIPKATVDVDIILMVEALTSEFVEHFWRFIQLGKYKKQQKNQEKRNCYRFLEPEAENFPVQIELFSRVPDAIELNKFSYLTPIPVDEGLSSLSAILLSDEYYQFTRTNSQLNNGIHYAIPETVICLKAFAYMNNLERKEAGEDINSINISKHKYDIFRLTFLLNPNNSIDLPQGIKADLIKFANHISDDMPDPQIFKKNGFGKQDMNKIFQQFLKIFKIDITIDYQEITIMKSKDSP